MGNRFSPGNHDDPSATRRTPRPPRTPGDAESGYGDSNRVGHNSDEEVRRALATTADVSRPSGNDQPSDSEKSPASTAGNAGTESDVSGAGNAVESGPAALGANTGGERAAAGRSDAKRSSRDHGNTNGI